MATSAIWKTTCRACWITFAPIWMSFSRGVVNDQCLTPWGRANRPRKLPKLYAKANYGDADANRLAKRLLRHCDSSQSPFRDLFTFLDHPDVPYENNHAERMIRPAVIPGGAPSGIRKNSRSNGSDKGAATQASLMSIYRTLKLRGSTGLAAGGLDPVAAVAAALRSYLTTGYLPSLPVQSVADG